VKYHEVFQMSRVELEPLIVNGNETAIIEALLSAAWCDPDWQWVLGVCFGLLGHANLGMRANAATCLGHLARIHKMLDLELVRPKLLAVKGDAAVRPCVVDALEDIHFFLPGSITSFERTRV
jgi:hypothetical protein